MAVTTSDEPRPAVPRAPSREATPPTWHPPPPATPSQADIDAMATGTYVMPEATAAPKAAPKSDPAWQPPPPATPTQDELDAIAAGTYSHVIEPQRRDVKPESSGEGYKTR